MKKILIVIHNMNIGGAQKSLLSFLQCLQMDARHEEYDIHVLPLDPKGPFLAQVPDCFTVKLPDKVLRWMSASLSARLLVQFFSWRGVAGELVWLLRKCLRRFPENMNTPQKIWHSWKAFVPPCNEKYDVAVAYMDGTPAYYVMDKVQADKKVLWLHSNYLEQGYQVEFDKPYFQQCDEIITVSEECREAICRAHPENGEKIKILENISAASLVQAQSVKIGATEFDEAGGMRLLTVGRLHEQKGIDLAVDAARCLKEQGIDFSWLIVGEGTQRAVLERKIAAYSLEKQVFLLGARTNPYVYMAKCDILVQPSRVEGKSIVLDEAKLLCKPIVVTEYSTVHDAIEHGKTGWIVGMEGSAIAEGIRHLRTQPELCKHLVDSLKSLPKGNEVLVGDYINTMF